MMPLMTFDIKGKWGTLRGLRYYCYENAVYFGRIAPEMPATESTYMWSRLPNKIALRIDM
jgi:hypothetical protein